MRIVVIGGSGHSILYLPETHMADREFVAVAPGSLGEPMDHILGKLTQAGYVPRVYGDYREMLSAEKPDVAIVDNYYAEHARVILDAFAAGCHVLSDKPAASSLQELEQVETAWKKAGTCFAAMFTYRYDGAFYRAWQLVQEGAIGKVRLINTQKSYKLGKRPQFMHRRDTYGGTIPWIGIHGLEWILWMSGGKLEWVTATQAAREAPNGVSPETTAMVQLRLSDGMMGSVTIDYLNPAAAPRHGDDRIRVVGTEGVVEVREDTVILTNAKGMQYPEIPAHIDMLTDFLNQIRGAGKCRVSASDALTATRWALLAQQAADNNEMVYDQPKANDRPFTDREFETYVELTSRTDNLTDNLRRAELLGLGGRENTVAPGAIIRVPPEQIGRDVFIGLYSYINGNVTIEDHVLIGPRCSITAGHHKFDPATGYFSARTEQDYDNSVTIGYGSWLASNVTVTAGVKVGRANLICAGAVVTHDTPDYAIMAGIPAKQIGKIDPATGEYCWFRKKEEQK